MKKCINFVMFFIAAVVMASCAGDTALRQQIESGKKHCPMNLGMAGQLTSMDYNDKDHEVDFVITLNKQIADVKDFEADPEMARQSMRLALSKGDMNKLLKMMVDADASLDITYKNRGSKDKFNLNFSAADLKQIYDNPMDENEVNKMLLDNQLKGERKRLPYKVAQGLMMTEIQEEGDNLIYICEVDENLYDVDDMGNAKDELKTDMRKMLRDRTMRKQAEILASLGKGFSYKYVGKQSGKSVIVTFSAEELGEIAGNAKK